MGELRITPWCYEPSECLAILDNNYVPQPGMTIEVGEVTNATGQTFHVNVERLLSEALIRELQETQMLWTGGDGPKLLLTSKIVEYEKGGLLNFKRVWVRRLGCSTILRIQCGLREGSQLIGSMNAGRAVFPRGIYTIGAWETIFSKVAKDVENVLQSRLRV